MWAVPELFEKRIRYLILRGKDRIYDGMFTPDVNWVSQTPDFMTLPDIVPKEYKPEHIPEVIKMTHYYKVAAVNDMVIYQATPKE